MQITSSDMLANAPLFRNYDPIPSPYEDSQSGYLHVTPRSKAKKPGAGAARKPWQIAIKNRRTFSHPLLRFKDAKDAAKVASYLHEHKDVANAEALINLATQSYD